jgi:HK97 family phage portal protein
MGWREALIGFATPSHTRTPDTESSRSESAEEERSSYYAPSMPQLDSSSVVPIVTPSSATQSVAIRSTQDLIASLASELPIDVYTGRGKDRRKLSTPGNLDDPGGDGTGREDWGYRLLTNWLGTGNAFGDVIQRDGTGRMVAADLFNPAIITPTVVEGRAQWAVNGRTVTDIANFKHWRVNPQSGQILGFSPIEAHAATIGVSIATTRFGRGWFADGSHSTGILSSEEELGEGVADIAKRRYMASLGTREPVVIGGKWKWDPLQVSNEESQFLETAGYSEAQCARIYGPGFAEILGYDTGQKMTYANVVDRRQDLLVLGMARWFRRYERILSQFLPKPQWVEINRDALLESTTLQRYQAHNLALSGQWKVINEVREHENLEPVPWGNEPIAINAAITKEVPANGTTTGP